MWHSCVCVFSSAPSLRFIGFPVLALSRDCVTSLCVRKQPQQSAITVFMLEIDAGKDESGSKCEAEPLAHPSGRCASVREEKD